jgi:hypothetical protein
MLMGGEYVLKKPTIQLLDKFDPNFIDNLNMDPMATLNNAVASLRSNTSNYYNSGGSINNSNNTKTFNPTINLNGGVKEGINYALEMANRSLQQGYFRT